jgi:hypothetical protein
MLVPLGRFSLAPRADRRYPHGILRCRYRVMRGVGCMTPITGNMTPIPGKV